MVGGEMVLGRCEAEAMGKSRCTHSVAAKFLDDAVRRDGSTDHWSESYVCETGSRFVIELVIFCR
jgi:hypothetical protein